MKRIRNWLIEKDRGIWIAIIIGYCLYFTITLGPIIRELLSDRYVQINPLSYSRDLDTVYTGITDNDGTGMPLKTAFGVLNDLVILVDTLDIDSLTREGVMALKDLEDLTDAVLFTVGDTTVTAELGKVVFKTSDAHFYGCVALTAKKWKQFDN
jgi:hypothetical protein